MIEKLGVQLFTIRDYMTNAEDIRASFKKLKEIGIDQAQTAGCAIPYEEFGKIAREEGIEIVGTHDDFEMMKNDFEQSYKNHEALGTKIMGIGGSWTRTVAEVEEMIEVSNTIASKIGAKGGKYTYHNHSHEFTRLDNGKTTMDMLVEGLNENASFCLDTYWVQHGGGDVREWIKKLTGRIDILHLKDMGRSEEPAENGSGFQFITEIGNGNLYWEGILEAAAEAGVKYYVIEQDANWINNDPFESLKSSVNYLRKFMK